MRDAAVYVREGNWPDAIGLWKRHYEQKKGKQKLYAACNIALGYEMQDSISQAYDWALKAQKIAEQVDGIGEKSSQGLHASDIPNYLMTSAYVNELKTRQEGMTRLKVQMNRNNDDF